MSNDNNFPNLADILTDTNVGGLYLAAADGDLYGCRSFLLLMMRLTPYSSSYGVGVALRAGVTEEDVDEVIAKFIQVRDNFGPCDL